MPSHEFIPIIDHISPGKIQIFWSRVDHNWDDECWPWNARTNEGYGFLYESRPVDLDDVNAVLPRYIRGDILVEMALEDVSLWPGPSSDKPNPYASITAAKYHGDRARKMVEVLETQDDDVYMQDLTYQYPSLGWPFAMVLGDSKFLQSHAI